MPSRRKVHPLPSRAMQQAVSSWSSSRTILGRKPAFRHSLYARWFRSFPCLSSRKGSWAKRDRSTAGKFSWRWTPSRTWAAVSWNSSSPRFTEKAAGTVRRICSSCQTVEWNRRGSAASTLRLRSMVPDWRQGYRSGAFTSSRLARQAGY